MGRAFALGLHRALYAAHGVRDLLHDKRAVRFFRFGKPNHPHRRRDPQRGFDIDFYTFVAGRAGDFLFFKGRGVPAARSGQTRANHRG
jgi:hypothetical protein